MDPVTLAITTALSAGVLSGLSTVSSQAILDGYDAIKNKIKEKYGKNSNLANSISLLEQRHDSKNLQGAVQEEVDIAGANKDEEILQLSEELYSLLEKQANNSINITGNGNTIGNNNKVTQITQTAGDNSVVVGNAQDVNLKDKNK